MCRGCISPTEAKANVFMLLYSENNQIKDILYVYIFQSIYFCTAVFHVKKT